VAVLYRIAADVVVAVHLGFIVFLGVGGFLVWRWPRVVWAHLPSVAYAAVISAWELGCPLTPLEKRLRALAGETGYEGSFVEHYLMPLIYPDLDHQGRLVVGVTLVGSGLVLSYGRLLYKRRSRPLPASPASTHTPTFAPARRVEPTQRTSSKSTTKTRVSPGQITPPAPRSP
jgi:hypothetical protein